MADVSSVVFMSKPLIRIDVNAFMAAAGEFVPIFAKDGCKPVSTLLGVPRLFDPAITVELEATAVP